MNNKTERPIQLSKIRFKLNILNNLIVNSHIWVIFLLQYNARKTVQTDILNLGKISPIDIVRNCIFPCTDIPKNTLLSIYIGNKKDSANESRYYIFNTHWGFRTKKGWYNLQAKKLEVAAAPLMLFKMIKNIRLLMIIYFWEHIWFRTHIGKEMKMTS